MVPLRIEDVVLLEDLGNNWNGRVDRVRNYENEGLRGGQGDPSSKIVNDAGVDLAGERVSVPVSSERDRRTNLKQIISEIVVNISVIVVITVNHADLVIWQVSGNQNESWGPNRNSTYPWFPRNTSRNDHNVSSSQGLLETVIRRKVSLDF